MSTMLLSLPSSGSDWFADLLQTVNPELQADQTAKEFFNPVCNAEHYATLKQVFGCELFDCYRNLAIPCAQQREALKATLADTWGAKSLSFTKENFVYRKIDFFCSHFDILVLMRSARHTFPPDRLRVLCWYDAIFQSFVDFDRESSDAQLGRAISFALEEADTLLKRAVAAHSLAQATILDTAAKRGIPVLNWSLLTTLPREVIEPYLVEHVPASLRPVKLAAALILTRTIDQDRREQAYETANVEPFRQALIDHLPESLRSHMAVEPGASWTTQVSRTSRLEVA